MSSRYAVIALLLAVAACGGGGSGGSGSGSGGSGTVVIPPPTTPTTPPPPTTAANPSLSGTLVDDSFPNDAGRALVQADGSSAVALANARLDYAAATRSYALSDGSTTQSFGPAEIDPGRTGGGATTYARSSSAGSDTLTLVRPGDPRATGGQYVGLALLRHVAAGVATNDVLAYGMPTPVAALPRSGTRVYRLEGLIATGRGTSAQPFTGEGTLSVDFATGKIDFHHYSHGIDYQGNVAPSEYVVPSTITAGSNGFIATSTCSGCSAKTPLSISGRFYGPRAQQVGIAFVWDAGTPGVWQSGSFAGDVQESELIDLADPKVSFVQAPLSGLTKFAYDASGHITGGASGDGVHHVFFNAPFQRYSVDSFPFALSSTIAADTDASFTTYDGKAGGASVVLLRLLNMGSDNPLIVLHDVRLGLFRRTQPSPEGVGTALWDIPFVYGNATPASAIPTSGSGHYRGILFGTGFDLINLGGNAYDLTGTVDYTIDFATGAVTGTVTIMGRRFADGQLQTLSITALQGGSFQAGSVAVVCQPDANQIFGFGGKLFAATGSEMGGTVSMNTCSTGCTRDKDGNTPVDAMRSAAFVASRVN